MSNAINSAIRKCLLAGIAKQAGVEALIIELDAARAGMYVHGVQAAIAAKGDGQAFAAVCDKLRDDFRANLRGIAVKFNCDVAKDKQGNPKADADGNPVYKVPSSLASMASHIKSAFEFGIDFGTKAKPSSFGAIRDAVQVARAEKQAATASPEDKLRAELRDTLADIATGLDTLDAKALKVVAKMLQAVGESIAKAA